MTTVAITQNREEIGRAISEALSHLPLEEHIRGKLVAVKPNDTWASKDDISGVTQADTLRAVLREVRHLDPREFVVTGGAGAAETDEVFRHTGMLQVVEEEARPSSTTTGLPSRRWISTMARIARSRDASSW